MDPWQRQTVDYLRAVRPGALLRFVIGYLRIRGEIALAEVRGQTLSAMVRELSNGGMTGWIISRDSHGAELSMTWARPPTREQVDRSDGSELA